MSKTLRDTLINNLLWFAGSLMLAFSVWFVATVQQDPINTRSFESIPVQYQTDSGMIITNTPLQSVLVVVRAQQSVLDRLARDDISVSADLRNFEAGSHRVPLQYTLARTGSADIQPLQVRVELAPVEAQQKEVRVVVDDPPPPAFNFDDPIYDVLQAQVTGAAERVNDVAYLRARVDLSEQRSLFEGVVTLVPVDAEGNVVSGVTVEPRSIPVSVEVFQREDARQVVVSPNILFNTLPEGYVYGGADPTPLIVSLGADGNTAVLQQIGDTVSTDAISLEGRTEAFTVSVGLDLPEGVLILNDMQTVDVRVHIEPRLVTARIEGVPVAFIGRPDDFTVNVQPETITVVLNGPEPLVRDLTLEDVQAVIDLNGRSAGTFEVEPQISLSQEDPDITRSLQPPRVIVTLTAPVTPTPEATAESE